jgi:hypothetical protein
MSLTSNDSTETPGALILAFRRQDNLLNILNSLRMGGITRIYLSIDGPKGPEDVQIGFSIEALVQNYCVNHSLELKLLRPKVNLGLSLAVLTALDWFFAQEKSGLVIEDDLYFQSDFVTYCQQALIEFELDKEVWLISGNRFDNYIVRGASNSWSTYPMIWGWATWSSRWPEVKDAITSATFSDKTSAKLEVREYWRAGLRRVNSGVLNSWAVPLAIQMKFNEKYCVLPPVNLVSNIGVDSNAEHTSAETWHTNREVEKLPHDFGFQRNNRNRVAKESDSLFEKEIYEISLRNTLSRIFSILGDWFRFPKKFRNESLRARYNAFQSSSR